MIGYVAPSLIALVMAPGPTMSHPQTDDRAMYGSEGRRELNWKPRIVAGWPARFLTDSLVTSVPYRIGPEDEFWPGALLAHGASG